MKTIGTKSDFYGVMQPLKIIVILYFSIPYFMTANPLPFA